MDLYSHTWTFEQYISLYNEIYNTDMSYCNCFRNMIDEYSKEFNSLYLYVNKEVIHKTMNKTGTIDEISFDSYGVYFYITFSDDTLGIHTYSELK